MEFLRTIVRFFTTLMGMSNPEDMRKPAGDKPEARK